VLCGIEFRLGLRAVFLIPLFGLKSVAAVAQIPGMTAIGAEHLRFVPIGYAISASRPILRREADTG
jgi:hypothetical protein